MTGNFYKPSLGFKFSSVVLRMKHLSCFYNIGKIDYGMKSKLLVEDIYYTNSEYEREAVPSFTRNRPVIHDDNVLVRCSKKKKRI